MNGIIFCVFSTSAISVLLIVSKRCREEHKKMQVKKESQQNQSQWYEFGLAMQRRTPDVLASTASESLGKTQTWKSIYLWARGLSSIQEQGDLFWTNVCHWLVMKQLSIFSAQKSMSSRILCCASERLFNILIPTKLGRTELQGSRPRKATEIMMVSMESRSNSIGTSSQDSQRCSSVVKSVIYWATWDKHQKLSQEEFYSCQCSMTSLVTDKAMKKNVWQMPESSKYLRVGIRTCLPRLHRNTQGKTRYESQNVPLSSSKMCSKQVRGDP